MKIFLRFHALVFVSIVFPLAVLHAQVGNNNPTGPTGDFNGEVTTGCSYDPYTGNAKRTVTDIVVAGAVGKYGLSYSRTWNSRNAYGPYLGNSGWLGSYDWSIDHIDCPSIYANAILTYTVNSPD